MRSFFLLLWSELKILSRNKQALFWRLFFPIVFMLTLGLFSFDNFGASKIVVMPQSDNEISQNIIDGLKKIDLFDVEVKKDISLLESEKAKIDRDEIDFVLYLPEVKLPKPTSPSTFSQQNAGKPTVRFSSKNLPPPNPKPIKPAELKLYYNDANVAQNQVVFSALEQMTTQINAEAVKAPELFKFAKEAVSERNIRYIDFLMPGVIAMSLMSSAIAGIAVALARYREKEILKRILATPVDRKSYIASMVLSRVVMSFFQATIIIVVGKLFYDIQIFGSYWAIAFWVLLGNLVFLNIGFVVASLARTTQAAESMSQVISMPLMFLSGVFFSTETLPKLVKTIVDNLPLSPIINSLREVIINGAQLSTTFGALKVVLPWLLGSFVIALLVFRVARE